MGWERATKEKSEEGTGRSTRRSLCALDCGLLLCGVRNKAGGAGWRAKKAVLIKAGLKSHDEFRLYFVPCPVPPPTPAVIDHFSPWSTAQSKKVQ